MKKKTLLLTALLIGIAWDILFWQKTPGISFPIFIMVCLTSGYLILRSENHRPSRRTYLLFLLLLLFSVGTCVRKDLLTTFLNVLLALFSIFILATTYKSGAWISFRVFDYVKNTLVGLGNMVTLPWKYLSGLRSKQGTEQKEKNRELLWQIIRGFLLAVPILAVFTLLLSSADLVFEQHVQKIVSSFKIEKLSEYLVRGILIFFVATFFIGIIQTAALRSHKPNQSNLDKPAISPFLGFTEGAIVLGSMIVLFTTFVIIQFRYFFSGQMNISFAGFTYAEYARRGFTELIAVAVFSLLLVQSLRTTLIFKKDKQRRYFAGLAAGLVLLVLVILASSFQRLSLYESAYGFTSLRTYSHVFIIWLGLLLIGTIVLEVLNKPRFFANAALLAIIGFSLSLNLLNVDAFIVHHNIKRANTAAELDMHYLSNLSSDAVPALVEEFNSSQHSSDIHEAIGGVLKCHQLRMEDRSATKTGWQSFHFSDWRVSRSISLVQEQIEEFDCTLIDW